MAAITESGNREEMGFARAQPILRSDASRGPIANGDEATQIKQKAWSHDRALFFLLARRTRSDRLRDQRRAVGEFGADQEIAAAAQRA